MGQPLIAMEMKWLSQVSKPSIANSPKKLSGLSGPRHVPPFTNTQPDLDGKEAVQAFVQGEDFPMEVALTLYVIFAIAVVIWCSVSRTRPSVNYVTISRTMLSCLRQWNDDLVVVEVRGTRRSVSQGALNVPADQLPLFLRWIPPRTTLVLCGASEVLRCRGEIALTLLRLGIEVVYVLEDHTDSSTAPTTPLVATRLL